MSRAVSDLDRARAEISAASSGGAPFLLAFALTLGATGVAAFWLDVKVAALITLFQGNVALPLAFLLERRMSGVRMSADNPLKPLSIQLAMSQILALPVVLLVYQFAPAAVPAAMAAIGAAHFLPYVWLQRTRLYLGLAIVVSVVPFTLAVVLRGAAAPWTLLFLSAAYLVTAVLIRRRAGALVRQDLALAA
ncbi:MAG: hypothetical protein NDJ94_19410, partial [Vicinamibacteria bacterium]|nr:hypothetical protein [Vicinamibacteria bacterium]